LRECVDTGTGAGRFRFALVYCPECHMAFVDPFPPRQVLDALYRADYPYHGASAPGVLGSYTRKLRIAAIRHRPLVGCGGLGRGLAKLVAGAERVARRTASYSLGVPPALPRDARILDFGFGTGDWLRAMRRLGFRHLYGHDVASNRENRERLRQRGIAASSDHPAEAFPEVRFDCVRLEHVFEHLPEPIDELRRLRRLLRPGGWLVMTFPSFDPWRPVETLSESPHLEHLQLPIHLVHHSRESARGFVEAAGFELRALRMMKPYAYISLAARSPR